MFSSLTLIWKEEDFHGTNPEISIVPPIFCTFNYLTRIFQHVSMANYRLPISFLLLCTIISLGTFGYYYFEDMRIFESLYMTLITISTVGFGEVKPLSPQGRVLTIFIIISGISLLTYTLGQIATIFIEGELRKILGRKKLDRQITKLRNHFIICGYGRIGSIITKELVESGTPLVIIEQHPDLIEQLSSSGILHLSMDATTEEALLTAGLLRAKGLVTAVSSDADNVFIALTARGLNPDVFILARASESANESKLLRAGANKVVSPYVIGGKRMAEMLVKPTVVDFIVHTMMKNELGLSMDEATISPTSSLVGLSLVDSRLRQNFGVIVVAIKQASGNMIFNPSADQILGSGDCIICIGKTADLRRMNKVLS